MDRSRTRAVLAVVVGAALLAVTYRAWVSTQSEAAAKQALGSPVHEFHASFELDAERFSFYPVHAARFEQQRLVLQAYGSSKQRILPLSFFEDPTESTVWGTLAAFAALARERQKSGKGGPEILLDIGANSGFFTQILGSFGLPVHSFDPSPGCCQVIKAAVSANRYDNVFVHNAPVSTRVGQKIPVNPHCDAGFIVNYKTDPGEITAKTESVLPLFADETVHAGVVKIDAEGSEIDILRSFEPLFKARRVHGMVVEIAPNWWQHSVDVTIESGVETLLKLEREYGFEAFFFLGEGVSGYGDSTEALAPGIAPLKGFGLEKLTIWQKPKAGKTVKDIVDHARNDGPGGHGLMAVYVLKG